MRKEQIEEMVEIVKPFVSGLACGDESGACELTDCRSCKARNLVNAIIEKDYRKQSVGEWRSELVKKCDWKGKKRDYYQPNSCSLCHEAVVKRTPYCPNCGAKMKITEGK